MSKRYSRGTTYTTSTVPDWRELLEDPGVDVVLDRVWWRAKATIYAAGAFTLALDDLRSWLWVRATEIAMRFDTDVDLDDEELRTQWLGFLWHGLINYGLAAHREYWQGRHPGARAGCYGTRWTAMMGMASIEANQEQVAAGSVVTDLFKNRRLRHNDPLFEVLLLERLEEKVAAGEPLEVKPAGSCMALGCVLAVKWRGYCADHYAEAARRGWEMAPSRIQGGKVCSIPDCGGKAHSRGWCPKHYQRWRLHGDPLGSAA